MVVLSRCRPSPEDGGISSCLSGYPACASCRTPESRTDQTKSERTDGSTSGLTARPARDKFGQRKPHSNALLRNLLHFFMFLCMDLSFLTVPTGYSLRAWTESQHRNCRHRSGRACNLPVLRPVRESVPGRFAISPQLKSECATMLAIALIFKLLNLMTAHAAGSRSPLRVREKEGSY